jgi:hypothetical protein
MQALESGIRFAQAQNPRAHSRQDIFTSSFRQDCLGDFNGSTDFNAIIEKELAGEDHTLVEYSQKSQCGS